MKRCIRHGPLLTGCLLLGGWAVCAPAQQNSPPPKASRLHNGWQVTPAGTPQRTGDMLLGCALSPDGSLLALTNGGYNDHHLYLVDVATGALKQTLPMKHAWNGIAWAKDGATLYVAGGAMPLIHVLTRGGDGAFTEGSPFPLPDIAQKPDKAKELGQSYLSGLALSRDGSTLFAANLATDTLYALSLPDGKVKMQRRLALNAHPYCLRLSPDGAKLYATQGALGNVAVLDAADLTLSQEITTEKHPNDLLFAPDGRLFVSCGNSDSVLAIDPDTGLTRERIAVTLTPRSPAGTTPNALALSPDGKTLYVANADNNAVAVVDIAEPGSSHVRGFIPTGWYPTAVYAAPDGKRLFLGSGKGMGTGPNAPQKSPTGKNDPGRDHPYIATLLYGMVSTLAVPDAAQLAAYTQQVMMNTPYRDALLMQPRRAPRPGSSPIPSRVGDPSPIKYVLYIIKENRTYDQVLGDMKDKNGKPLGNGDPNLTLFGEEVTPNIHALAREYVLLDNLYGNGEVSGSGHPWSTAAYETDIGTRAWMLAYSDKADWPLTDRDLTPPIGRLWDVAERHGIPFASYYFTWTTPNTERNMPQRWRQGFWDRRDTENADIFIADLKRHEQQNDLPRLMVMSLREDHTHGTSPGAYTPRACVASNDQGVGKIVAACSRSKFWKQMAIFVIEDDAQDGPDHVDAHRTEALVISPYTRAGRVDSTFYNTVSLLRTMELILGLPPMSQYDAATTPLYNAFMKKPDLTPYALRPPRIDLNAKNTQTAYGAAESSQMDFSIPDHLTEEQVEALNRILWHSIQGEKTPYPSSVRRGLFTRSGHPVR